jgi:type IV pilus assembly protein PilN
MRISVNLASQPFEDRRSFFIRWGAITGAVLLVTLIFLGFSAKAFYDRRQSDRDLKAIQRQRDTVQRERARYEAFLNEPQNRGTRDHAQFVNALILRKAFSWTAVFSELEHTLPPRVKVTAIRPEVNAENQLSVRLSVESESRDQALDFIKRIETTKQFRDPHLLSEKHGSSDNAAPGNNQQNPNIVTYEIGAEYVPSQTPAVRTGGEQ